MNWGAFFIALGVMVGFVNFISVMVEVGRHRPALHWSLCSLWVASLSIGIGLISATL